MLLIISLSKNVLICLRSIIRGTVRHVAVMSHCWWWWWSHMCPQTHWEETGEFHMVLWVCLWCALWFEYVSGPFGFYQVSVLWVHFLKKIYLFFDRSGYSLLHVGFLYLLQVRAALRYGARDSHCGRFSCCEAWFLKHRLSSCGMDLVALWHVGSSWTRNWTHFPFIDRQILKH